MIQSPEYFVPASKKTVTKSAPKASLDKLEK